ENWRPKVSDRGIILFHDVVERTADFGVWRLWEELTAQHRSFTFVHEHGLGLLAMGSDLPDEVQALLDLRDPDVEPVRTGVHEMGRRLQYDAEVEKGLAERDAARSERDAARSERDAARSEGEVYRDERDAVRSEADVFRDERDVARDERDVA